MTRVEKLEAVAKEAKKAHDAMYKRAKNGASLTCLGCGARAFWDDEEFEEGE